MSTDLVIRGASIHAMDAHRSTYRALAVEGKRISAVSPDPHGLDAMISRDTWVIDDATLAVLPAFFDNHLHLAEASSSSLFVQVGGATSIREFVNLVGQRAAQTPAGEWIQTSNDWNQEQFAEKRLPTAVDLDAATRDHPVVARRGGHLAVVNSVALRVSHIDRHTPDPVGGRLERTTEGEPNGVLEGGAQYALLHVPPPPLDQQLAALRGWCERLAATGLGGIRDPLVTMEQLRLYRTALERDVLPLRIRPMPLISPYASAAEPVAQIDAFGEWRDWGNDLVRTWGLKIVLDGGPESGALDEPYASDPSYRGQLNWDPAELTRVVGGAVERGWRVGTHAIGDRTVRTLLDAYEKVLADHPGTPPGTLVIEHGFLADREQRARAIRLGVWVTVQHALLYRLAATLIKLWGPERTREVMPVRAWLSEGAHLSAGTDYPIAWYAPLETLWGMATRETEASGIQGPDYAVDRMTAAWLSTAGTAQLLGENDALGTIAPGYFADLVVLPSDPLTCPVDALRGLKPVLTLVGGRSAYAATAFRRD
jgi:predicted amidohydrolase YtcJ